jgi:hypothetical protein
VTEYYKTGGSVAEAQKKICTEFLSRKGPIKNTVWHLVKQPKESRGRQTLVRTLKKLVMSFAANEYKLHH